MRAHPLGLLGAITLAAVIGRGAMADLAQPQMRPGNEDQWRFARGTWRLGDGRLEQTIADRGSVAILKEPAFSDFTLSVEFNVKPVGKGVRAAAVAFRASGTMSYYWLHLDTKNDGVILVRSEPSKTWNEIKRTRTTLDDDTWNMVKVQCRGPEIRILIGDKEVLTARDETLKSGRVGLGTSQGNVLFRNLRVEGDIVSMPEPLKDERPPYQVISRGEASGSYQAFPDACRLQNGDILAVFYAGYGHVSLPNEEWPKGGRICTVRSSDEGRTWTQPEILYDDEMDNRDPHIAQMSDGTLICTFFSLLPGDDKPYISHGVQAAFSTDGGKTWDTKARELAKKGWVCSAPVREMLDGTYILGAYSGEAGYHYGGVIRSNDRGKTWSDPIPIGREAKLPLDAETDVILCKDGTLFAALRSSKINMHYATSNDMGLTWSPVKDIGFKGHAPHLYRLSTDEIILTHRVPATSLHISRDECKTWAGPYPIDTVGGAYPATVELKDGSILVIYYEEGQSSAVRVRRFKVTQDGIESLEWDR